MRTVFLGDLHLVRSTPRAVTDDLAALFDRHAGDRVVVAGDLFDLSSDRPASRDATMQDQVAAALAPHAPLREAFAKHLERSELWLVAGNHDAIVGERGFSEAFLDAIGAPSIARARFKTSAWFFRDGDVHVEHGHVFDPDNAPAHPLVNGAASLGVHFVEEFIAKTGAHRYLQANDETPLKLLTNAFAWYGPRAPYVIYRYFYTAVSAMLKSGPFYRARGEEEIGRGRAEEFAREHAIDARWIEALLGAHEASTMESLSRTFQRLYFDRVLATIAIASGAAAFAAGRRESGAMVFGLGALAMGASWAAGHNRYAGTVADRLRRGAEKIREITDARVVVFGHTHKEALEDGYANTGSFAFPERERGGRPYLVLEGGRVERARLG